MQLLHGIFIALEELWAHKLRTFLTLLGNIVGVMSVMAVVSILDGADAYVEEEMIGSGSGIFRVQRMNALEIISNFEKFLKSRHNPKITYADLNYLKERVTLAAYMDAGLSTSVDVRYRRVDIESVSVEGRTENYPMLGKYDLADGRHFSSQEVIRKRNVAVIGHDVAEELYPSIDPIGKEIKVAGMPFQIAGVLDPQPRGLGGNPNLSLIIPITAFEKLFGSRQSLAISIKPKNLAEANACMDQARMVMRVRRHLGPKQEDNFGIVAQESLLNLWESISSKIYIVLVGIVSISLVVSGIIIMNIMLMSVTERTWEIGIRKALGATRRNILWQFLVESATLSMVGGFFGILAGFAVAALIAYYSPLPYAVKAWSILAGLSVTFLVGIFFGAYPAMQAARMDPIEALRYE
ncbi:MAG: ABC transporter permease [Acidobacteria bacterium]|nr:ABC transporter permease [Acidobacteriota bacterium]